MPSTPLAEISCPRPARLPPMKFVGPAVDKSRRSHWPGPGSGRIGAVFISLQLIARRARVGEKTPPARRPIAFAEITLRAAAVVPPIVIVGRAGKADAGIHLAKLFVPVASSR